MWSISCTSSYIMNILFVKKCGSCEMCKWNAQECADEKTSSACKIVTYGQMRSAFACMQVCNVNVRNKTCKEDLKKVCLQRLWAYHSEMQPCQVGV